MMFKLMLELEFTTSPGGWWVGGWVGGELCKINAKPASTKIGVEF